MCLLTSFFRNSFFASTGSLCWDGRFFHIYLQHNWCSKLYQAKRYVDSTMYSIPSSSTGSYQLTIRDIYDGEKSVNEAQLHAIYRYNVCGQRNKENHKWYSLDWPCSLVPLISLLTKPLRFFKDGPLMSHYFATNRRPKGIKGSQQDSSTAEM